MIHERTEEDNGLQTNSYIIIKHLTKKKSIKYTVKLITI